MLKKFYITKTSGEMAEGVNAPSLDRFQRMEQLNQMLHLGWKIKEFKNDGSDTYFLLERA